MKNSIFFAILLTSALAACTAPTITTPSPTIVAQPTRVAATSTTVPTQVPAATTVPASPSQPAQLGQPECFRALELTPAMTEGPFYKANTPERTSLVEPGMAGTKITLTGFVLTRDCRTIARALLDFWQADDKGDYDNTGYRLRGHLFSDATGHYAIETILPGLYPGRTRHIHVKVSAPNQSPLTTQLFFPNEGRNQSDSIFDRALLVNMQDTPSGKIATFNFVLERR